MIGITKISVSQPVVKNTIKNKGHKGNKGFTFTLCQFYFEIKTDSYSLPTYIITTQVNRADAMNLFS